MSLRTYTIERELTLPDGRAGRIRLGLADDGYISRKEQETVVLELRIGDHVEAALNTKDNPKAPCEKFFLRRVTMDGIGRGGGHARCRVET